MKRSQPCLMAASTASAIMATLFFGGYRGPVFLEGLIPGISGWPIVWLVVKIAFFLFLFIWVRATLPRFRYDQLMRFGWKLLLPLALANTMITAAYLAFARGLGLWPLAGLSLLGLLALFAMSDRVRVLWNKPTGRRGADDALPTRPLGGD